MKPLPVVVAVSLVALGCVIKFSTLFPASVVPWIGLALGVGGALATRLLSPFLLLMLPSRVDKVLSQINGSVLGVFGFLSVSTVIPASAQPWICFLMGLAGAFGTAFLQQEPPAPVKAALPLDAPPAPDVPPLEQAALPVTDPDPVDAPIVPPAAAALLIFGLASTLLTGCFCKITENVQSPRCQLQQATVDCAKLAAASIATVQNAQDIWNAVSNNGTNYVGDLLAIAAKIGSGGWEFVTCELAAMRQVYNESATPRAPSAMKDKQDVIARIDAVLKGAPPITNTHQMPVFKAAPVQ